MSRKRFFLFLLIITAVWSLDYGCMGEGVRQDIRLIGHIIALGINTTVGYIAYKNKLWARYIWMGAYLLILLLIIVIGVLFKAGISFSDAILLDVSNIRLLFTSPIPFAGLYIISMLDKTKETV